MFQWLKLLIFFYIYYLFIIRICSFCVLCSFTEDPEGSTSDDVRSRLKKKAVSGLQRKDSQYLVLL